ncbi:TadE/TadG family type IV pilus assembly protein [Sulfobacillus thermosulfidooxidans]|uniref:TadE/TadG family type IV pilus assembly protein n=1 Tax=Sulfobacillus thermosulfidooxidans TaxID=28034 RepID=UPI00055D9F12|nr:TadE/TadG family type IV pilus assembly protein [Sulfobacillus thermosulfidooxidans]
MKRVWYHIYHDHHGQALVEFALVLPLLLLFLFAIIQMGFLFYGFISIEQGARIGVRAASLGESSNQIGCAIYQQVNSGLFPSNTAVYWTATYYNNNSSSNASQTSDSKDSSPSGSTSSSTPTVVLRVSTSYPLLLNIPGFGKTVPMSQQYTMVQEVLSSSSTQSGSAQCP